MPGFFLLAYMIEINYLCLSNGKIDIKIAKQNEDSEGNQSLFCINGLSDYQANSPGIIINGDRELNDFLSCFISAIEMIDGDSSPIKKVFYPEIRDKELDSQQCTVNLEIWRKYDYLEKTRFKFTFLSKMPLINGAQWRNIRSNEFSFYVSSDELDCLTDIIYRLNYEDYEYEHILSSNRHDWAYPSELCSIRLNKNRILDQVKSHVFSIAPVSVSNELLAIYRAYENKLTTYSNKCYFLKEEITPWLTGA